MPATMDASSRAPRFARAPRSLALAAGAVLLGLLGPAQADPGASAGIRWERPAGLAGVDAYRLDFLGASGLMPLAAPLVPLAKNRNARPIAPVPFEGTVVPAAPEAAGAGTPAIRPVATSPLAGLDQQASGGAGYSLSDAVREAGWRKATAKRLRRMAPERPRF